MTLLVFVDYLEPDEHVHESQPSQRPPSGTIPDGAYTEIPVNAMDNPEYFDGPLGGGKPLPPDPRTNVNLNNNIDDLGSLKNPKEAAVGAAPRLRKIGPGNSTENADSYINTDYDHLSDQTPFTSYINPRSESMV